MDFAQHTIDMIREKVAAGGLPFATVIVKDGEIIAEVRTASPKLTIRPLTGRSWLSVRRAPSYAPSI